MKAKKGSKAHKAKLSAAQKRSWAKRRYPKLAFEEVPTAEIPPPTKEQLAHAASYRVVDEREHEGTSTYRWSAGDGCQQSNIPKEEFDVIKWINESDSPKERALRKSAMHGALYSGAGTDSKDSLLRTAERIRQNIAETEARKEQLASEGIPYMKPGSWQLYNGDPDAMFQQPPIHPNPVNHPAHYLRHPSGVECITITEHFNFNRGNAIKYIWRAGEKSSVSLLEDLRKAQWYLNREISRLEKEAIR